MTTDAFHEYERYCAPVTIAAPSYYDNFIVTVEVTYTSGMNTDFSDVRFGDIYTGELYPQFLSSYRPGTDAFFQVVIPLAGQTLFHMFFGNPELSTYSDGSSVYTFFDHFTSKDTSKWTFTGSTPIYGGTYLSLKSGMSAISVDSFPIGTTMRIGVKSQTSESSIGSATMRLGFYQPYPLKFAYAYRDNIGIYRHWDTGYTKYSGLTEEGYPITYGLTDSGDVALGTMGSSTITDRGSKVVNNSTTIYKESDNRASSGLSTTLVIYDICRLNANTVAYYKNSILQYTHTLYVPWGNIPIELYEADSTYYTYVDWVAIFNNGGATSIGSQGVAEQNMMFTWRDIIA